MTTLEKLKLEIETQVMDTILDIKGEGHTDYKEGKLDALHGVLDLFESLEKKPEYPDTFHLPGKL